MGDKIHSLCSKNASEKKGKIRWVSSKVTVFSVQNSFENCFKTEVKNVNLSFKAVQVSKNKLFNRCQGKHVHVQTMWLCNICEELLKPMQSNEFST